jgi:hypothetical protein
MLFAIFGAERRVNLSAVVTHELGHSFGLTHATPDEPSIMVPVLKEARFATMLASAIDGSTRGEFAATRCEGLRVE